MNLKRKVLIVDDSQVMQKLLNHYLSQDPNIEVVGSCSDPFAAQNFINENLIDVIILDLELPKMDGFTFLNKIMESTGIPTIILSSAVHNKPTLIDKLMTAGASAVLNKPEGKDPAFFEFLIKKINESTERKEVDFPENNIDGLILIASSTGGTEGVRKIVRHLPSSSNWAVVVVQHLAAQFTQSFAKSLDKISSYKVKEGVNGEPLSPGYVYIAPGNYHLKIEKSHFNKYMITTNQEPHLHSVRPAADVTFLTLPPDLISKTKVIILSGMGRDGAKGLAHLKHFGATTIAESESSCVVFGMPKAAIETGCVDHIFSIDEICNYFENLKPNKASA